MSIESPEVKPTACDTCRRLNIQCNLDNYIDDCERCTSLGERCFITDDYNVTIYKVPQRALHKFHSAKFICDIVALSHELHDRQSNGENTYVILDKIASEFVVIPEEAIQYEEVRGFLCYHFGNVMRWFQMNPEHQVWTVARYDQKTKQSLYVLLIIPGNFDHLDLQLICSQCQIRRYVEISRLPTLFGRRSLLYVANWHS